MPEATITNPSKAWQAGASWGNVYASVSQQVVTVKNDPSGTTRTAGDVVIVNLDANGDPIAQTTTTVNDKAVYGVVVSQENNHTQTVADTYAAGAEMPVMINGIGRINIGANTVAAKDILTTSGTAGQAVLNAGAPAANAVTGSLIAVALEASGAKDASNTIRAIIGKF